MSKGGHRTIEGFRKIVTDAYNMNGSGKRKFTLNQIISAL